MERVGIRKVKKEIPVLTIWLIPSSRGNINFMDNGSFVRRI
jgi:hypothetical protein